MKKYFSKIFGILLFLTILFFCSKTYSIDFKQVRKNNFSENKNGKILTDTLSTYLYNADALLPFYEKLRLLETLKDRKINVLHIGDSHIQGDAMTQFIRQKLQSQFGNAGIGFVFPHSLAHTNGSKNIRFLSNIVWNVEKITTLKKPSQIGLGGYSLTTNRKNFFIQISPKTNDVSFDVVKILTPNSVRLFDLATSNEAINLKPAITTTSYQTHTISKGETLYSIAKKYDTSVDNLLKINNLKGNTIKAGSVLKVNKIVENQSVSQLQGNNFSVLENPNNLIDYYLYENLDKSKNYFLIPNSQANDFTLNGLILENNSAGIIYHSIGINGGFLTNFNKDTLFFNQLNAVSPDLIIVSFGTNESFGRLQNTSFLEQIKSFISLIRSKNINCPVLFTTPPPSLFKRKNDNPFLATYSTIMIENAIANNFAVFDLYEAMGTNKAISSFTKNNQIASDKVHYTGLGYQFQGSLLYNAIIEQYKSNFTKTVSN